MRQQFEVYSTKIEPDLEKLYAVNTIRFSSLLVQDNMYSLRSTSFIDTDQLLILMSMPFNS